MSLTSVETGQAGRNRDRSYVTNDVLTITARHEYLGSVHEPRLLEVVYELVESTEFVWDRDQEEAEVSTTFDTAEVERVVTSDGSSAVAARNGDAIGITTHKPPNEVEQMVSELVYQLIHYHNNRLEELKVEQ